MHTCKCIDGHMHSHVRREHHTSPLTLTLDPHPHPSPSSAEREAEASSVETLTPDTLSEIDACYAGESKSVSQSVSQ